DLPVPARAARTDHARLRRAGAGRRRDAEAGRAAKRDGATARAREGARRRRAVPAGARHRIGPDGDDGRRACDRQAGRSRRRACAAARSVGAHPAFPHGARLRATCRRIPRTGPRADPGSLPHARRRGDRALSAAGASLRCRRRRQGRRTRHRAARSDRGGRPDRADRPAADRTRSHAARSGPVAARRTQRMTTGTLWLIPTPIGPADDARTVLPPATLACVARLDYFVVENARSARALLKAAGTARPLQALELVELDEHTPAARIPELLAPVLDGRDAGLLSEAGAPAVADPGASLVAAAHAAGIPVRPPVGP